MTPVCRLGHASEETDYCSVCGAPIVSTASLAPRAPAPAPHTGGFCPLCGEARDAAGGRYCEICRFDFQEQKPGPPPVAAVAPAPRGWEILVVVDPALDTDPDPATPCPLGAAARVIPLDRPELLVGRDDTQRDIHPEVPLADPGASRRHAKFVREADGGVALQDLASTNGSRINGRDVAAGSRRRLAPGDTVTLGRWTRLTLRARR